MSEAYRSGPWEAQKSEALLLLRLCLLLGVQMETVGWIRVEDDREREAPNLPSRVGVVAISSACPALFLLLSLLPSPLL